MKKMDGFTPVGILLGLGIITFGIFSNSGFEAAMTFIHLPSIFIVIGGLVGAMLVNFGRAQMQRLPIIIKQCFIKTDRNVAELVERCVFLADKARREGLLSLEMELGEENDDRFLKRVFCLLLMVLNQMI
nr:hypothetical protein [Litoribacterium kuwaitense]